MRDFQSTELRFRDRLTDPGEKVAAFRPLVDRCGADAVWARQPTCGAEGRFLYGESLSDLFDQ